MDTNFFKDEAILVQGPCVIKDKEGKETEGFSIVTDGSEALLSIEEIIKAADWFGYELTKP